ncbi:MAG TPA: hypothetical protein VF939_20350 [Puia sp.]
MWKSLNPGEKVQKGDTIRYQLKSAYLSSSKEEIYDVVKVELHYFEIALKPDKENNEEPDRKIIKYTDVGYHIRLEIWLDPASDLTDTTKKVTDNQTKSEQ